MDADDDDEHYARSAEKHTKNPRKSVAVFFGVDEEHKNESKWEKRRMRMANSLGKGIKEEYLDEDIESSMTHMPHPAVETRKKSVFALTYKELKSTNPHVKQEMERRKSMKAQKVQSQNLRRVSVNIKNIAEDAQEKPAMDKGSSEIDLDEKQEKVKDLETAPDSDLRKLSFFDEPTSPTSNIRQSPDATLEDAESKMQKPLSFDVGFSKIKDTILEAQNEKRQYGMGAMGKFTRRRLKSTVMADVEIRQQLDNFEDYRPFFTYWITTVQVIIFVVAISVYGIAPIGVGKQTVFANVPMPSLAIQTEYHVEKRNMWIGPRQADLIHLGAKYSPCMRPDENLIRAINYDKIEERDSACCIRNDGSGCVQTNTLSSWYKFSEMEGTENAAKKTGSVCGQDPKFCILPSSTPPFEWGDDITLWPVCIETVKPNQSLASPKDRHMNCEILGRPCCFGIQGQCVITTKDHCDLKRGFFHYEATLCSQVGCFEEICGMIPFARPTFPDQFYRLFTAIFLHGGLLHLAMSIIYQMWVMRDLEKLMGSVRMSVIYIGSGVAGNLASCIFIPYSVEVGPSGSHFGVAACLLVEVLQSYQMYKHPINALIRISLPLAILFILGLLPWFDNWSHIFGFFFGFLLAFALMPYVSFGMFDSQRKKYGIFICLGSSIGLFAILILIFYVAPLTECRWCVYFNCIPFTSDFCENMGVNIKKNATYSMFQ